MDAVFGEEEREEELDNASETASLVQGRRSGPGYTSPTRSIMDGRDEANEASWFAKLLGRSRRRDYLPVRND